MKYFIKQWEILKHSVTETSKANLVSIVCDLGIIIVYLILTSLFSSMIASTFSSINQLVKQFTGKPTLLLNSAVILRTVGVMILYYLLVAIVYSVLNAITWLRFMKKKITANVLFSFTKQTIGYLFAALLIVYSVHWLFIDVVWQVIDFVIIVLVVWILPILHVRYLEKKTFLLKSIGFFFKQFKHLILPGLVVLILVNLLVFSTFLFGFISQHVENILTIVVALFALSWARRYMMLVVRSIKQ